MTARSLPPLPAALAAKLRPSPPVPVAAPTRPTGARKRRGAVSPRAGAVAGAPEARGGAGPKPKRSPSSQRARDASGRAWEAQVQRLNDLAALAGVARLHRRPTATTRGGAFVATSGVDFTGHYIGSGQAIYCETKRCAGGRFDFAQLRPSQREELAAASREGAVAVVLVSVGRAGHVCALGWAHILDEERRGAKSLSAEKLRAVYGVPSGTHWPACRWLR